MDVERIELARGKLLEKLLDPSVAAASDAIVDLAIERDWTNGHLVSVLTRALMRSIDLQPTEQETKRQTEVVRAATDVVQEYAGSVYDVYELPNLIGIGE